MPSPTKALFKFTLNEVLFYKMKEGTERKEMVLG